MKNTIMTLSILILPLHAFSQSENELMLDQQKANDEKTLEMQKDFTKFQRESYAKELERLETNKKKLSDLESYEQNYASARIQAIAEISESLDSLSVFKKLGSKASFLKCLRLSLDQEDKLDYDHCMGIHNPKLSDEELNLAKKWKSATGVSIAESRTKRESIPPLIKSSESTLVTLKDNVTSSENREIILASQIKILDNVKKEYALLPANKKFTDCDASTPDINLEEKVPFEGATFDGAFHNVPRDNQDGLGTCYANAAKNLLVGFSQGKDVASFLDIALAFKESSGSLANSGLNGGSSCIALEALNKKGYCPQEFSPIETGERNHAAESLFNTDPNSYLATNVTLLREFLSGLGNFQSSDSAFKDELLQKSQEIVQRLKSDPSISIPLPIVRNNIPSDWKINETYELNKAKLLPLTQKEFFNDYKKAYKDFYPVYMKAVLEGKGFDEIFNLYSTSMKPFFTKYDLFDAISEFKRTYELDTEADFKDKNLPKKLRASIDFLKDITNRKNESDDEFTQFCSNSGQDSMAFLSALTPLVEKLRQNKLNEENLFDKEGKFRSASELMQLTVAPACLNPDNRKPLTPYSCNNGYDTITKINASPKPRNEKIMMLREKVVLSLIQGYPLGNSFATGPSSAHINTIVGLRFNKTSGQCEYRIRESQTGTSSWLPEGPIFDKINALTEVRREK